jgi:hypothetical protein
MKQHFMKRYIITCSLIAAVLFSCNDAQKKQDADKSTTKDTVAANPVVAAINLLGSYVGTFGDNKITLLITKATPDSVEGRTVVGGNDRPFKGTVQELNGKYTIAAKEPGDDQYDGSFNFSIDAAQPDVVKGSWKPNKPTATLTEKDYSLQRKAFAYLQDVGTYPQSSKRLLKEEDVENLMKPDLEMMRNEIFARHGFCFKKKSLREEFENKDWYVPNTIDIKNELTDVEKKNITLIKRYEKYAQEYGDDFGR